MMDQYIGIMQLDIPEMNFPYFTILKDDNGYKAINQTNNGYFTIIEGVETLEQIYNDLTEYIYNRINGNGDNQ